MSNGPEPVWAPTLRKLWADPEVEPAQIAARMGITVPSVRRRAEQLNLGPKVHGANGSGWTDERVELLTKLWREGLSCSQISKQLGGDISRNAVIGKVNRLGLSGRAPPSKPVRRAALAKDLTKVARAPIAPRKLLPPTAPTPAPDRVVVAFDREAPGTATPLTLGAHMCKWPIGDPAQPGFTHCGRRAETGPYCATHTEVAYQPAAAKKKTSGNELMRSLRRYM